MWSDLSLTDCLALSRSFQSRGNLITHPEVRACKNGTLKPDRKRKREQIDIEHEP